MGARLLQNYLKNYDFPNTVKRAILIQADIPSITLFNKSNVPLYNLYCPWDPTLFTSMLINLYLPAGLIGLKCASKNVLFPLWGAFNLHIASIGNKNIVKFISSFENEL